MSSFSIRPWTSSDYSLLHDLYQEAFPQKNITIQTIRNIAQEKLAQVWLCWFKDELVGFLYFWLTDDFVEIIDIATSYRWRRKKVGQSLLVKLKQKFSGYKILLEVRSDNREAVDFYKKQDFQQVGHRKKYYQDGTDALLFSFFPNP